MSVCVCELVEIKTKVLLLYEIVTDFSTFQSTLTYHYYY